jgi:hypothetical protein
MMTVDIIATIMICTYLDLGELQRVTCCAVSLRRLPSQWEIMMKFTTLFLTISGEVASEPWLGVCPANRWEFPHQSLQHSSGIHLH